MTQAASTPALPRKTIAVVADYGKDDLAFYEVKQKLLALYPNADVALITTNPFDTRETAHAVKLAAQTPGVDLVYHNTAPRKDDTKTRTDNFGEGLAHAQIRRADGSVVDVIGVSSGDDVAGNTFSELAHGATEGGYTLTQPVRLIDWRVRKKSQFRSRDEFPYDVAATLKGEPLAYASDAQEIPAPVTDAEAEARARHNTAEALALTYRQPGGNSENGYVTILSPRAANAELLTAIGPRFSGLEVDTLPLEGADEHYHTLPDALKNQPASTDYYVTRASFIAAQLALTPEHEAAARRRTLIALPEGDLEHAETLYEAQLQNGARILATNPKVFQFARDAIAQLTAYPKEGRTVSYDAETGQPVIATENPKAARTFTTFAASQKEALEQGIPFIPEVTDLSVVYADGYGNLKLSLPKQKVFEILQQHVQSTSPSGLGIPSHDAHIPRVRVHLKGRDGEVHTLDGFISDTSFGVPDGETAFSAGSSGKWDGGERGFSEIFLRGGNASQALGFPRSGELVGLEYLGLTYLPPSPAILGNGRKIFGRQPHAIYAGAGI